jgi:hypothetical protein
MHATPRCCQWRNRQIAVLGLFLGLMLIGVGPLGCRTANSLTTALTGPAGGSVRVQSLGDNPVLVSGNFSKSLYSNVSGVETTFLLSDVTLDELVNGSVTRGQVMHIELLWEPRAGWTPLGEDATNASIRYIVIADGEVGVYGGAGFASIRGEIGNRRLSVNVRDASLKLLDSTDGFVDLLTPARLTGSFIAQMHDRQTIQMHNAISQYVTNAFGRSMFVRSNCTQGERQPGTPLVLGEAFVY